MALKSAARRLQRSTSADLAGDLRPHYDFRGGVRGKYTARYREGTNIVLLEPDVAARFRDAGAVNRALRALAEIADETRPNRRSRSRTAG